MGFYVAAPLGAISILYIRRTLQRGKMSGFFSALGVNTSETIYASAAIYGLSFISDFLLTWKDQLKICCALFLLFIGIKSFFINPDKKPKLGKKQSLAADYFSMLFLSFLNPIAIVGFVVIFATFDAGSFKNNYEAAAMLAGFATASFSYCLCLIGIASFLGEKFKTDDRELIKILNQMSGIVIILFTIAIFTFSILQG